MKTPRQEIEAIVSRVARELFGADATPGPYVRPCPDTRYGDFQTNLAMAQGKKVGVNPRELAQKVAKACAENPITEKPEVAGAGFVNFKLKPEFCARQIGQRLNAPKLGVEPVAKPEKVMVEYSSPTPIKELHVGHLRSTIMGDVLQRVYKFIGHNVVTDNHLGDWGTGWGMVIWAHKTYGSEEDLKEDPLGYMEALYIRSNKECGENPELMEKARLETVKLQQGDAENTRVWKHLLEAAREGLEVVYQTLGSTFDMYLGESFYNPMLQPLVDDMLARGIARKSDGAVVIFYDEDPKLKDHPFMIQKSDGAFLYSTTDIATVEYRVENLKCDNIIVVTDGRQQMHFQQIIAACKKWKYPNLRMEHVWFGAILGPDKKPLKGRAGGTVKLRELLQEAQDRALEIVSAKRPELNDAEKKRLAKVIGIGALKYADLCQNRNLDYVFNWDKLLAFDGNTAPYLQNAYVRIRSIFRKAETVGQHATAADEIQLKEPAELNLAKKLLDFGDALGLVVEENRPHYLCVYLFELATAFHQFYESCPVLQSEDAAKESRLALCALTAQTLKTGLDLLGIEVVEQM
jgi:arginyl-tRNA synthetase